MSTIGKIALGGLLVLLTLALTIPVTAQDGAQIYEENCQRCHADDGKGVSGANFSDPFFWKSNTQRDLENTVKSGVEIMPSFEEKLTDEEIEAVLAYASDFAEISYSGIPSFIPVIPGFTVIVGLVGAFIAATFCRRGS